MSFFESLRWQAAPKSLCQHTVACKLSAVVLALLCSTGMAQTTPNAQEAIKKALQAGQLDQAAKLVQQERERAPKDVQMRFMEGVIQAQQGQTDKAIDTFKQITESHPDLSEAYNNLGVLYAAKGRLEESRAYLEKALQTHPSYAAAHRNLSDVHSQLAKQSYAKALQVDPKVKHIAPQLTLLGSIGPEKRAQTAPIPTAPRAPTTQVASAAVPTPAPTPHTAAKPPTPTPPTTVGSVQPPAKVTPPTAVAPEPSRPQAPAAPAAPAAPEQIAKVKPTPQVGTAAAANPASKPDPAQTKADETAIRNAVMAWAKAWSQKDMTEYLAAYAESFTPPDKMSRAKWENDRRVRIVSKKSITVDIKQLQITLQGPKATVRFQQIYESDNFKGNSRKTMEMDKQGQRWLIVRETVN